MDSTYILMLIIPLIFQSILAVGDPYMIDPNIQYQGPIVNVNARPLRPPPEHNQLRSSARNSMTVPQSSFNQGILHTSSVGEEPRTAIEDERSRDAKNLTLLDLVDAFNDISEHHEDTEEQRAVARDFEYAPYGYRPPSYGYRPPPYGYSPRPNYGPNAPSYHEPAYPPPPPSHHTASKISLLKPALDIVKPVTTKVAGKVSGLIGLVLALLTGSSPDDLELKGFKDIIINGIVKPLLIAKGGIKSLISKLTIPVISLLLINLEVLVTIWWLWEDCPQPVHTPPPAYPYPRPNYNTY